MYRLTTLNLSPEADQARTQFGVIDRGEVSGEELLLLLGQLRAIDPVQNHEADPQLILTGRARKFRIRTGQGKLFLYDAREPIAPYAELTAAEIVAQLEGSPPASPEASSDPTPMPGRAAPNRAIAAAILMAGVALNGYTLYSVFYTKSVNEKPTVTLLTDPLELAARQHDILGTFATGEQPGDRVIVIAANGEVSFSELGAKTSILNNHDRYRIGRQGDKFCLATVESGVVEVISIDTLSYYRDTYKRR